jgi:hypothetical protein
MKRQIGNLSVVERVSSTVLGAAIPALLFRGRHPLVRAIGGAVAGGLIARAAAGHCGVKSMLTGHTSLRDGLRDQWRCLLGGAYEHQGLPGSPAHRHASNIVDESVDESFPASDPPASRLPDEPPVNAAAKWDAARQQY